MQPTIAEGMIQLLLKIVRMPNIPNDKFAKPNSCMMTNGSLVLNSNIFSAVNFGVMDCRSPPVKNLIPTPQNTNHFPTRKMVPDALLKKNISVIMEMIGKTNINDMTIKIYTFFLLMKFILALCHEVNNHVFPGESNEGIFDLQGRSMIACSDGKRFLPGPQLRISSIGMLHDLS